MPDERKNTAGGDIGIVHELWAFMRVRKKYWLAPILIAMVLLGLLMLAATHSGALAPLLYAM
ncbi:MAG: hypothetical protein GX580_06095 [Candidatus Hydrogenedens sp.]|nr:hypothetical protein [Candidatus Hydrogenedentota bacterium]NLF57191.1 hypothetical protein [Candidatus Hydrogenedens sp.]